MKNIHDMLHYKDRIKLSCALISLEKFYVKVILKNSNCETFKY